MKVRLILIALVFAVSIAAAQNPTARTGYVIAGIVVDDRSGQPLANSTITIAPTTAQDNSRSVVTGSDGRFRFTGLSVGKYSLIGKRRGYSPQGFDGHEQYSSAIAVGDQQDPTSLVFRLHPDAAIRGKITDENDEPIPQMQVILFSTQNDLGRRSTRLISQATSNDLGEYSFGNLGAGTYYLLASGKPWYSEGFADGGRNDPNAVITPEHKQLIERESDALDRTYPLTFFDNEQDWTQASGIDLAPGDRFTANFHVVSVPAATLRMAVGPEPTDPTEPGTFRRRRYPRLFLFAKMFDDQMVPISLNFRGYSDGMVRMTGIPPGHYVLQAQLPDQAQASMQELDISGDMDVPKLDGSTGATVSGKFVWEGPPINRFGVVLTNSSANRFYFCVSRTGGECSVSETVQPGKYEVAARSVGGDIYVKSVEVGGVTSSATVQIPGGSDVQMTIALGRGTGAIDGVALLDGKPKAGAMVVLVPADGWAAVSRFRRDQSDSDGTFSLRNIVPGNYKVVALRDGWKLPWSDPKTMKGFLTEGTPVQIGPNSKAQISVKVK